MTHTLYWAQSTASLAVHIVLEESGMVYDLVEIDTTKGEHRLPAYLAINPVGKVPTLVLSGGEIMTETAAICLYLADRYALTELAPALDDPARGQFLRHLMYLSNTVQELYKQYYYSNRFSIDMEAAAGIKASAVDALVSAWKPVNDHLQVSGPYLLGAQFSIADIYLLMLATWYDPVEQLLDTYPAIRACFDATAARPASAHCLAMQGKINVGAT